MARTALDSRRRRRREVTPSAGLSESIRSLHRLSRGGPTASPTVAAAYRGHRGVAPRMSPARGARRRSMTGGRRRATLAASSDRSPPDQTPAHHHPRMLPTDVTGITWAGTRRCGEDDATARTSTAARRLRSATAGRHEPRHASEPRRPLCPPRPRPPVRTPRVLSSGLTRAASWGTRDQAIERSG